MQQFLLGNLVDGRATVGNDVSKHHAFAAAQVGAVIAVLAQGARHGLPVWCCSGRVVHHDAASGAINDPMVTLDEVVGNDACLATWHALSVGGLDLPSVRCTTGSAAKCQIVAASIVHCLRIGRHALLEVWTC